MRVKIESALWSYEDEDEMIKAYPCLNRYNYEPLIVDQCYVGGFITIDSFDVVPVLIDELEKAVVVEKDEEYNLHIIIYDIFPGGIFR